MEEKTVKKPWYYYLEIRLKTPYNGRKVWFFNENYICDCVNAPFQTKEAAEKWIPRIYERRSYPYMGGNRIESVTVRKTRKW